MQIMYIVFFKKESMLIAPRGGCCGFLAVYYQMMIMCVFYIYQDQGSDFYLGFYYFILPV